MAGLELWQILALIALAILSYVYLFRRKGHWEKLGVPTIPSSPIISDDLRILLGQQGLHETQIKQYNLLGDLKFGGTYLMTSPFFFPKDPALVDKILTSDFTNFYDRGLRIVEPLEPLSAHLFSIEGKRWKGLRNKLSPTFTSGKLKTMHQQLIDCADNLMASLETSSQPIDFRETIAKFTTDVIGACAYGLNINALNDPDSQFRKMGKKVFQTSYLGLIRQFLRSFLRKINPKLIILFNLRAMALDVEQFFLKLVKDTIKYREESQSSRNDFLQLLINLRKQDSVEDVNNSNNATKDNMEPAEKVELDDNVIAANAFLFFVAGFETTASTISYCLYELSKNQELQDKVVAEMENVVRSTGGQPTYDAVKTMPLLDAVISETLRKYPPAPLLLRVCTKDYQIPGTDIVLPKGCRVEIPVYALHHDAKYYSDPEKFDPERFYEENKRNIPKGAYLPFGDGPRICIGLRFAQMEMKVCLTKLLTKYKITKNHKMGDSLEFDPKSMFILVLKGGIWLDIEPRNK